ncbi:MAG: lipid-binding SYLF domain-containing protein [Proteobacteria bacterium]|nr:lipid-binding SYLF domain-containing protein [Pseudomonadota bacterium]
MRRIGFLLIALLTLSLAVPASASEQQELVDRGKLVVDRLRRDQNMGKSVSDMIGRAKAVLIVPNLWRAGFFFGGSGGSGMLLAKGADGSWSAPAFYGIGGGSFGLQIGAEMQELMLFVLTDGGLAKLMDNQVKIGADLTFALGPVGAGMGGATTPNFGADLVAYSSSIGLYGGINLEGGLIAIREEWNRGYYGEGATSREILFNRRFDNPGAADLRSALAAPPS